MVAFDLRRRLVPADRRGCLHAAARHRRPAGLLLDRFAGDIEQKLIALLRFLGPLTGGASAMRAF
jgi:hypothetical protein